jgi:hypothetical protein
MSIACDVCSSQVDDTHARKVSSDEMRGAVQVGFSVRAITWGPVGEMAKLTSAMPGLADITEAEWKRGVTSDTTGWKCCPRCYEALQRYSQASVPAYRFREPDLYSGFPLEALKYLFAHIPEQDFEAAQVSQDFVKVVTDTVGAELAQLCSRANITFVKGSTMGDEVQRTKELPSQVTEQIVSLYPETRNKQRFPLHVRTFHSTMAGRYGLLVFVYHAK